MTLATETKLFELADAKVFLLSADTAGGSPTYGSPVDIPGVLSLGITPHLITKELRGDSVVLDLYSKADYVDLKLTNAKISLNILDMLMGGTVTPSGTTPNMIETYDFSSADEAEYVKIEGQAVYADVGDVHVVFYKGKIQAGADCEVADNSGDFAKLTATIRFIPTTGTVSSKHRIWAVILNETETAIT